ncbi:MAG: tRNA (guanosine(46)-N7)-methyltransferase TrmB [Planctomycetota bacterium]
MTRHVATTESPYLLNVEAIPRDSETFGDWETIFGRDRPLRVEVGVGNSPFLIELAKLEPEYNYVGLEYCYRRVLKFLQRVHASETENIRFFQLAAEKFLREAVAPGGLDHIFVAFPDPWPKNKHRKHRFVREAVVGVLARRIRPGGGVSLKTDAPAYAEQMLRVMDADPAFESLGTPGEYAERPRVPFPTQFELRFVAEKKPIYYLEYRKKEREDE